MALYLDLPVYKVCSELYVEFVQARRALPRTERYTVGQELDRAIVEVLVMIQRINSTREKVPLIARARQLVVEIQVRTRVLRDVKALSIGTFTRLFDLSENLSKQLASWQRFSQKVGRDDPIAPRRRGVTPPYQSGMDLQAPQDFSDANAPSGQGGRPESAGSRFGGVRQTANPMSDNGDPTANTEVTS